ncbi:uncharacterized protein G2W53_006013 [Senna tora]|uniref:Uncharacterized protein n=1 Tax=Senna tora TaxID=362788 RepID=A0A834X389_9FABA|nr:uncharacterized protein G2W53_006013 [Senna tora]
MKACWKSRYLTKEKEDKVGQIKSPLNNNEKPKITEAHYSKRRSTGTT